MIEWFQQPFGLVQSGMHPIHDQHDWNIPGWIRGDPFSNKPKLANGDGSEAMMFLLVVYIYIWIYTNIRYMYLCLLMFIQKYLSTMYVCVCKWISACVCNVMLCNATSRKSMQGNVMLLHGVVCYSMLLQCNVMLLHIGSTAQGGGGSFKNRKPIGEIGCCESGMAERIH